jgi:hypothetical protein
MLSMDPARAAKIITDVVGLDEPPLRLLLGSDAVGHAEQAASARAAKTREWAEVSRSTDYPADG